MSNLDDWGGFDIGGDSGLDSLSDLNLPDISKEDIIIDINFPDPLPDIHIDTGDK